MPTPRNVKTKRFFLNEVEMERFLRASRSGRNGVRDYAIAKLMIRHTFRASELCDLRMEDLHLDRRGAPSIDVNRQKGSHSMQQPTGGYTLRALNAWLAIRPDSQEFDHVFLTERGMPMNRKGLYYLVKEWGDRALLPFTVHPHMLRHTGGYVMANNGTGFREMQDLLGHMNPRHTTLYTKLDRKQYEGVWGDW